MRISDWSSDVCSSDLGVAADDWLEEDPAQKRRLRLSLKLGRLFNRDPMAQRAARQQRLAEWRFQRGLAMLAAGELVATHRPHAHTPLLLLAPTSEEPRVRNESGRSCNFPWVPQHTKNKQKPQ